MCKQEKTQLWKRENMIHPRKKMKEITKCGAEGGSQDGAVDQVLGLPVQTEWTQHISDRVTQESDYLNTRRQVQPWRKV